MEMLSSQCALRSPYSCVTQAIFDALAKTLYARLFDWLVGQINKKINSLGSGAGAAGGGWW